LTSSPDRPLLRPTMSGVAAVAPLHTRAAAQQPWDEQQRRVGKERPLAEIRGASRMRTMPGTSAAREIVLENRDQFCITKGPRASFVVDPR
jgi:hypothetical protein